MDGPNFAGKCVLVVGAGRANGIAFGCAERLAALGASVALADLSGSDVRELAAALPGAGHSAHLVDVTDEASVAACLDGVQRHHGSLDGALLAAAILKNQPFLEIGVADWRRIIEVNLTGMFIAAQAVARSMTAGGGRIVCVASNAGRVPRLHNASYGSAKAAVIHMVRCMALELAPHAITVNALCPGSTASHMALDSKSAGDPELVKNLVDGSLAEWRTGIPLGKLADIRDQADAAAFLLSAHAKHITGQALCVDGGQTFC